MRRWYEPRNTNVGMTRRLLPLVGIAALAAALGCADLRAPIIVGEGYAVAPTPLPWLGGAPPTSKGGGPSDKCHDPDDLDLGDPAEVPEGFEEGDDSEFSPAHPPHLKDKKKRGVEENI